MNLEPVPLISLATVRSGGGAPQEANAFGKTGLPFIRAGSLPKLLDGAGEDSLEKIDPKVASQYGLKVFPVGTVLFAKSGMSATKGHVYRLRGPAYVVNHLAALVPHESEDAAFLERALQRFSPTALIRDPSYPSIRLGEIESMKVLAPTEAIDRKRIAEILDKVDALRVKRKATLTQIDTLTQSMFLDMIGDPATNTKRWPVALLRETTARIQIGPFGSLLHQEDYVEGGIPLVNPKHIQQRAIQPDPSETLSARKFAELDTYHLQAGDVVMGRRGEMGRCAIVNEGSGPLLCGTGSLFVRPDNEHTTSLFLLFLLSSVALRARLERLSLGQTLPNLNSQIVESLEVPLPPLAVQLEFAERVEGVHRLAKAQTQAANQLSSLFASLQQRAFRGEL